MNRYWLRDAEIEKLALCKVGANQQRIFLLKSGETETRVAPVARLIKEPGDDWRVAYVPVAVPDAEEKPGLFGDPDSVDLWLDRNEIAKAAHSFMRNGAGVVAQHFDGDQAPGAQLVENTVALADLTIGDQVIKEGTWYVGIEFDEAGRELVSKGEIDAVSIEGWATRQEIAKSEIDAEAEELAKDATLVPNKPGVTNWVERTGGLPKYIADIAGDLITEKGKTTSQAIQLAVGIVQRWCRGEGDVNADTRAKSCAAVAEWEAKRAAAHGMAKGGDRVSGMADEDRGILRWIAKKLGARPDECSECADDYDPEYVAKREFTAERRKELAQKGLALSDGSFPIETCADAMNARHRIGTGGASRSTIVAHIQKREKALNCNHGSLAKESGNLGDVEVDQDRFEALEAAVKDQGKVLTALAGDGTDENPGAVAKLVKAVETLGERIPEPKPKEPTPAELGEQLAKVEEGVGKLLGPLAERIEALEEGDTAQPDADEEERVAKAASKNGDSKFAGILGDL